MFYFKRGYGSTFHWAKKDCLGTFTYQEEEDPVAIQQEAVCKLVVSHGWMRTPQK